MEENLSQSEADRLKAGYTAKQRAIEIGGIALFFGLTPIIVLKIAGIYRFDGVPHPTWTLLAGCLGGLLFADWVSGFFHWAADNWGSPDWPVVGPHFIRTFRHHHLEPEDITTHGFVELNGNLCVIAIPAFWWADLALGSASPASGLFWGTWWLTTCYAVLGTNQVHSWAHNADPPRIAKLLQRLRLILTPTHHDVHHERPHNRNYAITTGWTNPLIRAIRFYEILEWAVTATTGARPENAIMADTDAALRANPPERAALT